MADSDPLTAEDCRTIASELLQDATRAARADSHEGTDHAGDLRTLSQKINDLGVRLHANPAFLTEREHHRNAA